MCCNASMWIFPLPCPKQCLHQERNTTCVSSCLFNSSTVGPGGGFRALGTGSSSLSCMTGSEDGASCVLSSITGFPAICSTCSTGCSLLSAIIRCTHQCQLSGDPSRTFDSHVSNRCFQQASMVSRRKTHAPCGENTTVVPPSFMEDTAATGPSTPVTWYVIP